MTPLDWIVFTLYGLVVLLIGGHIGRNAKDRGSLFIGNGNTPGWAVAISVLATSASGATFIGGPQASYAGDLTYLSASIGSVLGAVLAAVLLVPRFATPGATSVYESIGKASGELAQRACATAFLGGRLLASGSRLYIAAIPCSLIIFGDLETTSLLISVAVLGLAALTYASYGGIRAVIWTDALQALVMVAAVTVAIVLLWGDYGGTPSQAAETLGESGKLLVFDLGMDITKPFTIWGVVFGLTLFNAAAFGTDQDLAQRLLTTDSPKRAARALMWSSVLGIGLVGLFLGVGLLLYLREQSAGEAFAADTRRVFLDFILSDLPVGVRGLMIAGLFAAAMSSTDSALNGMSSSLATDFKVFTNARAGTIRLLSAGCGLALMLTACGFVLADAGRQEGLIPFALGVMIYAYAGLLGVFISALVLGRGSAVGVILALLAGAGTVAWLQFGLNDTPALGWRMLAGFVVALGVCAASGKAARP